VLGPLKARTSGGETRKRAMESSLAPRADWWNTKRPIQMRGTTQIARHRLMRSLGDATVFVTHAIFDVLDNQILAF
jgi:hypothetical protein